MAQIPYTFLGNAVKSMNATSGTIPVSNGRQVNVQVNLDGNAAYEVAVLPVDAATGTCSKANCAAVLSDLGTYEASKKLYGGYYIAWRMYNGATGAAGTAEDKIMVERYG